MSFSPHNEEVAREGARVQAWVGRAHHEIANPPNMTAWSYCTVPLRLLPRSWLAGRGSRSQAKSSETKVRPSQGDQVKSSRAPGQLVELLAVKGGKQPRRELGLTVWGDAEVVDCTLVLVRT